MNRREFSKRMVLLGAGLPASTALGQANQPKESSGDFYEEPVKRLPVKRFDVGLRPILCKSKKILDLLGACD
jgi:hypothetical protein